jgi:hypothetical protein
MKGKKVGSLRMPLFTLAFSYGLIPPTFLYSDASVSVPILFHEDIMEA